MTPDEDHTLNYRVATEVMGWQIDPAANCPGLPVFVSGGTWTPTHDANQTGQVIAKMISLGWNIVVDGTLAPLAGGISFAVHFQRRHGGDYIRGYGKSSSLPEATCLAALKSIRLLAGYQARHPADTAQEAAPEA